jgi:HSP20 family protein
MLMRTDPFRELERLTQQVFGTGGRPNLMPMDAFRKGDQFFVRFDLPGVERDSIELTVEENVLTVKAERSLASQDGIESIVAERPWGTFTRQLFLGDTLDADRIEANYSDGVLALTIPVREAAKPRRVEITSGSRQEELDAVS